jgi:hypothetical protein
MTGPKIQIGADLSSLTGELNKLQQQMRGLETACANLGSGLDKGPLKKTLSSLSQQADALSQKLGEQIDMGKLNPAELDKVATAFEGIGKAAGKVENKLYGVSTTTAWMGQQAQYGRQVARHLTQLDTLQDTLAKKGRRRSLDEIRDIEKRASALIKNDPRFKTAYRHKTLQDLVGGDWHVYKDDLKSKRLLNDFYQAAGIDSQTSKAGFVREAAGRVGGAVAQALPGGSILVESLMAAEKAGQEKEDKDGKDSGVGAEMLMAFGKKFGPAAIAYAAYKGVTSITGKYGDAKEQAINVGFLTHAIQGSASDFDRLNKIIGETANAFGASKEEVTAMSSQFAKTAGTLNMGDVGQAGGFARAYGINPAAMGQFLGIGRITGASRNDSDSKRLALYIGEAVSRSGATPKMEEFLAVAGSFLQHTAQSSLASPNAAAYLDLLGSLTGKGSAPGLLGNPMNAGSLIMQADAATRRGGTSEASHTFWLGALMNGIPGINAFDAPTQLQGGLFGTADESFGPNSAMYKMAANMKDKSMLAHLSGMKGGKNNLEMLWGFGKHHAGGKSRYMTEILKSAMGLDDRQAQNFFNAVEEMGGPAKVAAKLKADNINIDTLDFTKDGAKIAKMMGLASGDKGSLMEQAKHLLTLPNLSKEDRKSLEGASEMTNDRLKELVINATNTYDIFKNTGDAALYADNQMNNKLQELVTGLVKPISDIKDGIIKIAAFFPDAPKVSAGFDFLKQSGEGSIPGMVEKVMRDRTEGSGSVAGGAESEYARMIKDKADKLNLSERDIRVIPKVMGYSDLYNRAGKKYGVDPKLLAAIAYQESSGNPNAIAMDGGQGLMQFMPQTAKAYNLKDPYDPEQAIDAGAHYVSDLMGHFKNDPDGFNKAIAGYNAGQGAIDRRGIFNKQYVGSVLDHYQKIKMLGDYQDTPLPTTASPQSGKLTFGDAQATLYINIDTGGQTLNQRLNLDFPAPVPMGGRYSDSKYGGYSDYVSKAPRTEFGRGDRGERGR